MELSNLGEIAAAIAAIFTALGLLWRYLLSPLWKLTKRLRNNSQEMFRALPVLFALARRWPLEPSDGSLGGVIDSIEVRISHAKDWIRALLDALNLAAYEADINGNCVWVSDRWRQITGLTSDEAAKDGWINGVAEKDRQRVSKEWNESLEEERLFDLRYAMVNREGEEHIVRGRGNVVRLSCGKIAGFIGICFEK